MVCPTVGNDVYSLSGVAGENQLFVTSTKKTGNSLARLMPQVCAFIRKGVDAPMDVGIVVGVVIGDGVNYRLWFLRSGSIVQVNQGVAMDGAGEDGEV